MVPEIYKRMGCMKQVHGMTKGRFFRDPLVDRKKKLQVAQSMLFAKGLFQAGVWPILTHHELKKVHGTVMSVFRSICRDDYMGDGEYESDAALVKRA